MSGKKKFKLLDVILSVICVVFVAEAIAPAAAIGNQQFFWWIFLIITFLLPYGLIVSELGTAYADDEGGLYDWVRRAFGDKWGARVSWYYWINGSYGATAGQGVQQAADRYFREGLQRYGVHRVCPH